MQKITDYTEDWKQYWEFRYGQRVRTRLKKAAENPTRQFLPVKPSQLNPSSEEYEWAIEIQHLRQYPDPVLADAQTGFREFVADNEITDQEVEAYDLLPVNFTENYFDLRDHFWEAHSLARVEPNTISSLSVELTEPVEKTLIPASISYECPEGHSTKLVQPTYTRRTIENCAEADCSNSVFAVSQNTRFLPVLRFNALCDNSELEVVAAGINTEDRIFEELSEGNGSMNMVGILRNVVERDQKPKRVFEVLNRLNS